VVSAYNPIPSMDSDFNTWLSASNYPFRIGASRNSVHGITIPEALFREFNIVAPSPDEPTGDTSKLNSPVWISSIERIDTLATELRVVFSTYNLESAPKLVEFASMILQRNGTSGQVVAIQALSNLLGVYTSEADNFLQGFGTGHVVLSGLWGGSNAEIADFFDAFLHITDVPAITTFAKDTSILSSFAVSRVPRYVPTKGQFEALTGSSARRSTPINPSDDNRFITEKDEGLGDPIDFSAMTGFTSNPDIETIGYKGTSVHKMVKLVVDQSGTQHDYTKDILPRLICLFGRQPVDGDIWLDGTYYKVWSGSAWQTL
jgi:hypothetical protein